MKKKTFTQEESLGLTQSEIREGIKYLKKHGTKGVIPLHQAYPLFELYLIGYSLDEIYKQYPQYSYEQIICTCAIQKWGLQKQEATKTLLDTIKTKVTKAIVKQVEFITGLLNCYSKEREEEIRAYLTGLSDEPPSKGLKSIKEYHEAIRALQTILQKNNTILDTPPQISQETNKYLSPKKKEKDQDPDLDGVLNGEVIIE